ncbi:PilX N-terminal domain-containing pilus assembly protein [Luteimonas sp. SX5]|uniref:PilX N-terminal domain-containing pilus assembly protein n=1 Tax=Luteimonas galliterrae TaxID=2940486 RepID=A0ABT0MJS6_9GAMM|nr:PilX N-terminal domain-containing pilus assembly protein [Luteimonas galliterrae]MCL1635127.1 PilX N-terminal domain-containing pilus assembly protein [Luteimonas galliterrae]
MTRRSISIGPPARNQRGAVLYVALIILILLALIGVIGMQVSGMQERMSANYLAGNLAFQRSEGEARSAECALEDMVNRTETAGCDAIDSADVDMICDNGFDPGDWAEDQSLATSPKVNARLIGPCISGNSDLDMGRPLNEDPNPIYQVTVYSTNDDDNPTAAAAIDTIFRP